MNMRTIITIRTSSIVAALVGGLLLSFVGNASATLSLDYTLGLSNGPPASIYYNPADLCLHGNNIAVTSITGIGTTPANSQTITGGFLDFVSGPFTGITGNTWNFSQGGSITVTGGIAPLSITNLSTSLLSGAFDSVFVTQMPLYGQLTFAIAGGTFSAVGSQSIYNYFNTPTGSTSGNGLNLSFIASPGIASNSFISNSINGGNIVNVLDTVPLGGGPLTTPIPAAAWLLGSGLLGLAGLRSRRLAVM
jgi:hypothetical protein